MAGVSLGADFHGNHGEVPVPGLPPRLLQLSIEALPSGCWPEAGGVRHPEGLQTLGGSELEGLST